MERNSSLLQSTLNWQRLMSHSYFTCLVCMISRQWRQNLNIHFWLINTTFCSKRNTYRGYFNIYFLKLIQTHRRNVLTFTKYYWIIEKHFPAWVLVCDRLLFLGSFIYYHILTRFRLIWWEDLMSSASHNAHSSQW